MRTKNLYFKKYKSRVEFSPNSSTADESSIWLTFHNKHGIHYFKPGYTENRLKKLELVGILSWFSWRPQTIKTMLVKGGTPTWYPILLYSYLLLKPTQKWIENPRETQLFYNQDYRHNFEALFSLKIASKILLCFL